MQGNFDVKYDMKDGWKPMDPRERAALRQLYQGYEKNSLKSSIAISQFKKNDQQDKSQINSHKDSDKIS